MTICFFRIYIRAHPYGSGYPALSPFRYRSISFKQHLLSLARRTLKAIFQKIKLLILYWKLHDYIFSNHKTTNPKHPKAYRHTALDAVSVPSRQDVKQELQFKMLLNPDRPRIAVRGDDSF